ncbi:NUAK family SNF1-like kinase 1 [Ambystoma mexicanum]|uniref:NUAK family SNF1-like kinase 1 n=1 Tax=Ambystoma mexicanum TaxID=8296 RepID=UPI0037E85053
MTGVTPLSREADRAAVAMPGRAAGCLDERRWAPERSGDAGPQDPSSGSPASSVRGPAGPVRVRKHQHSVKSRYEVLETLGRGTYGKVKKATERGTGRMVAIKSIGKDKITDELDKVHLQREIEITALLKHEHIVKVYEVFENKDKIVMVMEYASNGELYDYVNNRHLISENEARGFFRQIVSAVHYCHKKGVVHRDLKLENILLDENLHVKLADFGLSTIFQRNQVLETFCGSPLYASPEIVNGLPYEGPEVDCWALGVLLYALVYGSMPFDNGNYKTLAEQISSGDYRKPPHVSGACGLIDWMLTVNAKYRATIEDIANHWWVNWGFEAAVCDCDLAQDCHSPLLARYIDCQNTLSFEGRGFCGEAIHPPESSPRLDESKEHEAGLRKSKKENDIKHPQQDTVTKATSKKPKGILKKRSSFDSAFFTSSRFTENVSPLCYGDGQGKQDCKVQSAGSLDRAGTSRRESPMTLPRKGILKKHYERESGYSSSPERGVSTVCPPTPDQSKEHPVRSEKGQRSRKGILKRNGKFSTSLDLPIDCSTLKLSDSLKDLLLFGGRPSSVISDDSFLSSDSFDLLDMTTESKRQFFSHLDRAAVYSSASEDDERTALPRDHAKATYAKGRHEPHSQSFFQEEHSVVTDIYTQAKKICDCMNE